MTKTNVLEVIQKTNSPTKLRPHDNLNRVIVFCVLDHKRVVFQKGYISPPAMGGMLYGLYTTGFPTAISYCGMCGKSLTDKESKRLGLGPECARQLRRAQVVQSTNPNQVIKSVFK
jgi:hypothetical protein